MCGIVGYFGKANAVNVVLCGLEKLEYRGYDSAGIALMNNDNSISLFKEKGRVSDLKCKIDPSLVSIKAIGHTRWATHGEPDVKNAHPHYSNNGRFYIVHNGIIDNYNSLKDEYLSGYKFNSQTDTEIIANLIEYFSNKIDGTANAIRKALSICEGSYAVLVIDKNEPNKLYFACHKSNLLVGKNSDGYTLASDIYALVGNADSYIRLNDQTFGVIDGDKVVLNDITGFELKYKYKKLNIKLDDVSKGGFPHYMIKEINEQPYVIHRLISNYYKNNKLIFDKELIKRLKKCSKINLVACGTSMHSSYIAKYYFETYCKIPAEVYCASELIYEESLIVDNSMFIYISQSGETADSLAVMKKYKDKYKSLVITNNVESTMARLANYTLDVCAGPEIAVASTKAYVAQVALCAMLAFGIIGKSQELLNDLNQATMQMEELLSNVEKYKQIAQKLSIQKDIFFIGKGIDYYVALEASLKLKEVSYIHCEAYYSGEFKHGPIAMIKNDIPVIAVATQRGTLCAIKSNLAETKSRKADTYLITTLDVESDNTNVIIPSVASYLTPLVSVVACQIIAYYAACYLGNDVDKPLNLAKSVTVE